MGKVGVGMGRHCVWANEHTRPCVDDILWKCALEKGVVM